MAALYVPTTSDLYASARPPDTLSSTPGRISRHPEQADDHDGGDNKITPGRTSESAVILFPS